MELHRPEMAISLANAYACALVRLFGPVAYLPEVASVPLRQSVYCGLLVGDDGTSCNGGRGFAGRAAPGNGRISTGGGSGSTCWLATGGTACGGRGALTFGRKGTRCGARAGGTSDVGGSPEFAAGGKASGGGGVEAGITGGRSPRSMASSRLVSRSMVRTASQDDSADTSMLGSSLSGVPTAKSWISGWPVAVPAELGAIEARMSAWSAGMS
jgi:hypothetical protein